MKSIILIAGILLLYPVVSAKSSAEKQASRQPMVPYRVAILPVMIHSPENIGYIREGLWDMLISRMELSGRVHVLEKEAVKKILAQFPGEISVEKARRVGEELGADHVVFGSLTKLGESASLDLRVLEIKEEKAAQPVFLQASKMEEMVGKVDELARRINEKILGYSLTPVVAEKRDPAAVQREMAAVGPTIPGFRPRGPGKTGAEFWQSQPFAFEIKGLAIGDVDGDGKHEMVMIDSRFLYIYRWEKEFRLIKRIEGGRLDRFLAVDVADIPKDGKAEIFITSVQDTRLASLVVAHREGDFRVVASNLDWFFRAVDWGEKERKLLGQKMGRDEGLIWPIYEMGWDGKTYTDIRQLNVPRGLSVNSLTPFTHEGKVHYAFIDTDSRLKVMNPQGKVVWKARDTYGSSNGIRIKPMPTGVGSESGDDILFVNIRLISRGNELFVIRNISPMADLFKRARVYTRGEVQRLMWTGALFMETWKSQEISGYLADFQFAELSGEGGKAMIVAVQFPKEYIVTGDSSSALMVSRVEGVN